MDSHWKPLEIKLGTEQCVGFMFMVRLHGINHYKHGITRRYLLLDDEGRAYRTVNSDTFQEIPFEEALAKVEVPLRDLGATLQTPYDAAFRECKTAVLRAAGIDILRSVVTPDEVME